MKKYKINRKLIDVICDTCSINFKKPLSEYKKNLFLKRRKYCSRFCVGKSNHSHLDLYKGDTTHFKGCTKKDEYTPYRYYLKNAKARFKECTISLQDIKEQWEKQKGICTYSKINLVVATHTSKKNSPIYTASLDRITSSLGYIKGNIQFVSRAINYMKNTMSHEETIFLCKTIARNITL